MVERTYHATHKFAHGTKGTTIATACHAVRNERIALNSKLYSPPTGGFAIPQSSISLEPLVICPFPGLDRSELGEIWVGRVDQDVTLLWDDHGRYFCQQRRRSMNPSSSPIHRDFACGLCVPADVNRWIEHGSRGPQRDWNFDLHQITIERQRITAAKVQIGRASCRERVYSSV